MSIYKALYDSPVGTLTLIGDEACLISLLFSKDEEAAAEVPNVPALKQTVQWLDAYFAGNPSAPQTIPLFLKGTPFQKICWQELTQIPYGQTISYSQLAKRVAAHMGMERMSSQAVGQAIGKNPIPIIIPCHRVIGANGKLTGYAWGLDIKTKLLELEKQKGAVLKCICRE